jgi:hypothetical protein
MFRPFQSFKPFKSTEQASEPEMAAKHVLSLVEKMQRAQNKFHEPFRAQGRDPSHPLFAGGQRDKPWDKSVQS